MVQNYTFLNFYPNYITHNTTSIVKKIIAFISNDLYFRGYVDIISAVRIASTVVLSFCGKGS